MPCSPDILKEVPLFSLLDDDELAVLSNQVEVKTFATRQRIYKAGEPGGRAYFVLSGTIKVSTLDRDHQDVIVDTPSRGEFFGFASMLENTPHQTEAIAEEPSTCIEIDREDIFTLLKLKPHAGMDILTAVSRQIHAAHTLVRDRSTPNPNEIIEEKTTTGDRIADSVAHFGGSWAFILSFAAVLVVYTCTNVLLRHRAWDPYPFILLNLFLSMLAAVQAPVIMMSQNRQDTKDRVRSEMDFEVNRRAEYEIQGLSRKLHLVNEKIGDLEEMLREKILPRA